VHFGSNQENQIFTGREFSLNKNSSTQMIILPIVLRWFLTGLVSILSCVILSSCQSKKPQVQLWQAPQYTHIENPEELSESKLIGKVEDVAILPFLDNTKEQEHTLNFLDLKIFAEQFSSHLVGSDTFKNVTFPAPALEALAGTTLSLSRQDDLKEIGNLLEVDAIIFGVIQSYNMYHPPKMSISMKFYLTRAERFASASEISALAHSGVPLNHYNPTFFKQLWNKSAYFDSASDSFNKKLGLYLKTHESDNFGFGTERFVRTKRDFIEVIAFDLAASLNFKTIEEEKSYVVPTLKGKRKLTSPRPYFND